MFLLDGILHIDIADVEIFTSLIKYKRKWGLEYGYKIWKRWL